MFGKPNIEKLKKKRDVSGLIKACRYKDGLVRSVASLALSDIIEECWNIKDAETLLRIFRECVDGRLHAAYALGEIKDERTVEPLIELLGGGDWNTRLWAAVALGEIADRKTVGPLIEALRDEDSTVRREAANALSKIKDKTALEPLASALLEDESVDVRSSAASALGKIGASKVITHLFKALEDREALVREKAADALGDIGDKRAFGPLRRVLKHEMEGTVRGAAIGALKRMGLPFTSH